MLWVDYILEETTLPEFHTIFTTNYHVVFKSYFKLRQLRQPLISKWSKRYLKKKQWHLFQSRSKFISNWGKSYFKVGHNNSFSAKSQILLQSYFSDRFQQTRINGSLSNWAEISVGVPQGSILGSLLFNIFLNDVFLFISNSKLCNYTDDNTSYTLWKHLDEIKVDLQCNYSIS